MKTYKKGISLIVLVVTIIVLAILASAVIISLSNANIIQNANEVAFKNDMNSYKEAFGLYVASIMADEKGDFDRAEDITTEGFKTYLGENLKEKYESYLNVVSGNLVYNTQDATLKQILREIGMIVITPLSEIKIGDVVEYTPTADPNTEYPGATYAKDTDTTSATYNTYIESETTYKPGSMTWVYLGQDENGNILLTSRETTAFEMRIIGEDAWVTGPDRMDTLCNTLYGNNTYGQSRNMKIQDIDRTLDYDGPKGSYYSTGKSTVPTDIPMTFAEIQSKEGIRISSIRKPRLSDVPFSNYLSNTYDYTGTEYKDTTTEEYKLIFYKANSTTKLTYWLSSASAFLYIGNNNYAKFNVGRVLAGKVASTGVFRSDNSDVGAESQFTYSLRPVIVLKTNIHFGEKNDDGEWTLIKM